MSTKIVALHAHEILDSRGNPTIQATVLLENGISASASVPSGASTGSHEALELRDGDVKRYRGLGVLNAVKNVETKIAKRIVGMDVRAQQTIDEAMIELDGTPNKSKLGANAILSVSLACARAASKAERLPLYAWIREAYGIVDKTYQLPFATMNVLNGGAHAGWILDFQEYMIVPLQKTFRERVRCGSEVFHALGDLLKKKGFSTLKGDEGGYAAPFSSNEEAIKYLLQAIKNAGYKAGENVVLALDPAVSELYDAKKKRYVMKVDKKSLTSAEMIKMWKKWIEKYPIVSLEDGLAEDDWDNWALLTEELGDQVALVGDDFFVTNVERVGEGIARGCANAVLIKVNQIGTLTEAMHAIFLAQENGYMISVSHRSGETEDTTIADLAVAVNAEFIKTGSLSRSERLAKYNRLLEIEEEVS